MTDHNHNDERKRPSLLGENVFLYASTLWRDPKGVYPPIKSPAFTGRGISLDSADDTAISEAWKTA